MGTLYSSLSWDSSSLEETIYRVLEAKFVAENAPGVGKTTVLQLLDDSGVGPIFTDAFISPIKSIWERKGRPKLPKNAVKAVGEMIALRAAIRNRAATKSEPQTSKDQQ
jgi:hypothetical protein